MEEEQREKVLAIVADQLECNGVGELPEESSLQQLDLDDLDRREIANELEADLELEFPEEEEASWQTLGDIFRSVRSALETNALSAP